MTTLIALIWFLAAIIWAVSGTPEMAVMCAGIGIMYLTLGRQKESP